MKINHEDVKDPQKLAEDVSWPLKPYRYEQQGYYIDPACSFSDDEIIDWPDLNEMLSEIEELGYDIELGFSYKKYNVRNIVIKLRDKPAPICLVIAKADTRIEAVAKVYRWCKERKEERE